MSDSLHDRIAAALGWSRADAASFSLRALRDLVRPVSPALASEITAAMNALSESVGSKKQQRNSRP